MASYEAPNGEMIEFPDEMSEEQVKAVMKRKFASAAAPKAAPAASSAPSDGSILGSPLLGQVLSALRPETKPTDVGFGLKLPLPQLPDPGSAMPFAVPGGPLASGAQGILARIGGTAAAGIAKDKDLYGATEAIPVAATEAVTGVGGRLLARLLGLKPAIRSVVDREWSQSPWQGQSRTLPAPSPPLAPSGVGPILTPQGVPANVSPMPPASGPVKMKQSRVTYRDARGRTPGPVQAALDALANAGVEGLF